MNLYGYDWPQGGTKQVVYVDGQSHIIELCQGLEGPWQSADLTGLTAAPLPGDAVLAGSVWSAGRTKQVAYVDEQSHIIELYVAGGSPWQWADVTALTGAPLAGQAGALAGYDWLNGQTKQIASVDAQGHVIELCVARGCPWQWADLTALTGAPSPGGGALTGYDWPGGGTKQVAYVDGQGHVIELWVARENPWQWADLTALTGAPLADQGALAGYAWSAGGTKQVVYRDQQSHVVELFVARGSPWQWVDLTALTGAPQSDQGGLAGYDWLNGQTKQIASVDAQGHVIELCVARESPWQWADVTALTGAPPLHQRPLTGYAWVWGAAKHIASVDDQGHVIELGVGLWGQWGCANLTALTRRAAIARV